MEAEIFNKFDIVFKVRTELNKESDRGACLMVASYLERELEDLIFKKLVGSNNHKKELFKFNGPLGTFSAKIKLAFSLGFISKECLQDLEIIRGIRNLFGHNFEPISFETDEIKKEVDKLKSHFYPEKEKSSRSIFFNTFTAVLAEVHYCENIIFPFVERTKSIFQSNEEKAKRRKQIEEVVSAIVKPILDR